MSFHNCPPIRQSITVVLFLLFSEKIGNSRNFVATNDSVSLVEKIFNAFAIGEYHKIIVA